MKLFYTKMKMTAVYDNADELLTKNVDLLLMINLAILILFFFIVII